MEVSVRRTRRISKHPLRRTSDAVLPPLCRFPSHCKQTTTGRSSLSSSAGGTPSWRPRSSALPSSTPAPYDMSAPMQVQATRALLALLVLSAAGATACREQRTFDPAPQEPRHPRDKSGHGGAAGAGNDPAPCVTDSDCDNHKACDGEERCDAGICVSGEDPCASLAEEGCTIECEEIDGGASCLKAPLDEDGDGHVASTNTCFATSELPRDDCDDSDPNTYPGAEEVCDGVANSCTGLSDFAEGFPLAGEFRTLFTSSADESGGNYPAACWNEPQGKWGVVWGTSKRLLFAALHPDGTVA